EGILGQGQDVLGRLAVHGIRQREQGVHADEAQAHVVVHQQDVGGRAHHDRVKQFVGFHRAGLPADGDAVDFLEPLQEGLHIRVPPQGPGRPEVEHRRQGGSGGIGLGGTVRPQPQHEGDGGYQREAPKDPRPPAGRGAGAPYQAGGLGRRGGPGSRAAAAERRMAQRKPVSGPRGPGDAARVSSLGPAQPAPPQRFGLCRVVAAVLRAPLVQIAHVVALRRLVFLRLLAFVLHGGPPVLAWGRGAAWERSDPAPYGPRTVFLKLGFPASPDKMGAPSQNTGGKDREGGAGMTRRDLWAVVLLTVLAAVLGGAMGARLAGAGPGSGGGGPNVGDDGPGGLAARQAEWTPGAAADGTVRA